MALNLIPSETFGDRLRLERKRIGITLEEFGRACGVTKGTQFHYEKNARSPDAVYLLRAHGLGADVTFLITGERRGQTGAQPTPPAPAPVRDEAAPDDGGHPAESKGEAFRPVAAWRAIAWLKSRIADLKKGAA
jgi:transcriptional regulator with XRE-family HTH domain